MSSMDIAQQSAAALTSFGTWIRTRFVEINTALESLYWTQDNRSAVETGQDLKADLLNEGTAELERLTDADITNPDADQRLALLGEVGYFMAACRRHEIRDEQGDLIQVKRASQIALQLGTSLGTVPRFLSAHMETHNRAIDGSYRTFTAFEEEQLFLDYNTRSALRYTSAADALLRTIPLGISHPVTRDLLDDARNALRAALAHNIELSDRLDVDRFFFSVRPYYKPHLVGSTEFRGANAGDFAAFNEVDTLLGLCSMADISYAQLVTEKLPYLVPEEQRRLRSSLRQANLLDAFLEHAHSSDRPWFQQNAAALLDVIDVHGQIAAHHHDDLVDKFIARPAMSIPAEHLDSITASGPPLDVLVNALEKIRDQRLAAPRTDIVTRHDDVASLRSLASR